MLDTVGYTKVFCYDTVVAFSSCTDSTCGIYFNNYFTTIIIKSLILFLFLETCASQEFDLNTCQQNSTVTVSEKFPTVPDASFVTVSYTNKNCNSDPLNWYYII